MVLADLIDTLSRIGAIGGILSIVGVGLLILLVAGQSRQIRSMREWIDEEPQRQTETAQRVIAEVQRRIAAARDRRSQQAPPPSVVPPVAAKGAVPAPGTLGATPEAQAIAKQQELVPAVGGAAEGTEGSIPPPGGDAPAFAPLTPAGGAPGGAAGEEDQPAVVSEFLGQETQAADAIPEADLLDPSASSSAARAADDLRFGDDYYDVEEAAPRSNRLLFGAGAVALVAGIILLAVLLFGGGGSDSGSGTASTGNNAAQSDATPTPKASTPKTVDPSDVNVKVLNGSAVTGLAQRVTDKLSSGGYATTTPDTWSNGGTVLSSSTVYYRSNFKTAGTALAKSLGLASTSVQAINSDVSVAAGQGPDVVVLIGTDLTNVAPSSTTGTSTE